MEFEGYSLEIPEASKVDGQYVYLKDGATFRIRLINHRLNCRVNVQLSVNGFNAGTFRLEAGMQEYLDRPAYSFEQDGFTFSAENLEDDENYGLIVATFIPEDTSAPGVVRADMSVRDSNGYPVEKQQARSFIDRAIESLRMDESRALTVTYHRDGQNSYHQEFWEADPMIQDLDRRVTIAIRLMTFDEPKYKPKTTGIPLRRLK